MDPTFEECLQEAYAEYVRSWLDEHRPEQSTGSAGTDASSQSGEDHAENDG